jgi:hypothetical protein
MKRLGSLFLACVLLMVFASSAAAQDGIPTAGEATGGTEGGGVEYKKETTYDFDGDDVEGNLVKPSEANIGGEQRGKTSSLIKIRQDFIPEMMKSVEDL